MKKLFALSLAALMVMSLGVTAFAAVDKSVTEMSVDAATDAEGFGKIENNAYYSPAEIDPDLDSALVLMATNNLHPGTTIYFSLMKKDGTNRLTSADAAKNIKVSVKALTGGEYVESYRVEYKRFQGGDFGYVLAVKTKERADTGTKHVGLEVTLSKTSPANYAFKAVYNLGFSINFDANATHIYLYPVVIKPLVTNVPDTVETIEFVEATGVYFETDMFQQPNGIAAFNTRYSPELLAKYEKDGVQLAFYNGNGMVFAKIGELTLPASEGSVVYVQDGEGNLTLVENAEYDSAEEALKVPTRVLGRYVVSNKELNLNPAEVVVPEEQKPPVNTGAAA